MTLVDHRQEKERKGKKEIALLDWDLIARLNTLAGRIGTSTRPGTTHNVDRENKARQQLPPADLYVSKPSEGSATGKDQRDGTTTPKRATAVQDPPPQCCCTPTDHLTVCRNTESETTNARGPRHNRRWTLACAGTSNPPLSTPLARAWDHPTRRTAPHPGLVPRIVVMVAKEVPRPPRTEPSRQTNTEVRIITLLRPRTEPPPSSQKTKDVARAVFRRCIAPGSSAELKAPPRSAAGQVATSCRCRKHHQNNDVPHRTRECPATPGATERCKQTNDRQVETHGHQQESRCHGERKATPIHMPYDRSASIVHSTPRAVGRPRTNGVSRSRRLQEGYDAHRRRRRSSRGWTGFTPRDNAAGLPLQTWHPQQGDRHLKGAAAMPPGRTW
jgi:hypothetical protein